MPEVFDAHEAIALTVLLPAFNEQHGIARLLAEVRSALADRADAWEIVVADDGSTDRTAAIAEEFGVRAIRRVERGGYGAAVKAGLAAARGEWVALLDADGSYPAAQLPALLQHVPAYEQVNGARQNEAGGQRALRVAAKWVIRRLAECISGRSIPDLNTGMKVFRRETALKYLWVIPDGFSCSTSLTLAFMCNGYPVKYVPIEYRPRTGVSKFRALPDTAQYCMTIIRMTTCFRPLRVFMPLAASLATVALARGAHNWFTSPTGLADADVILATGAIVIFALGLLADLVVLRGR